MDLAVYISELLGLRGEVNVPGVGHFAQVRVNGYYNEKENKFYPPSHHINFDPETREDEGLANYIAEKKNISLASAKYFIEKYVNGVKQQLSTQQVEIAGLGHVFTDGQTLGFKATSLSASNDPAFFGMQPVNIAPPIEKPAAANVPAQEEPKEEKIVTPVPVAEEQPKAELIDGRIPPAPKPTVIEDTEDRNEPEYAYEEPQPKSNSNVWIALLLIVISALLAILGLYKYKPDWFDRSKEKNQTFVAVNGADTTKVAADSVAKTIVKHDSAAKAVALANNAPVDTAAVLHYEILGGAYKTEAQANDVLAKFQKLGLQPRILKHIPGNSYKITLGTYFNKDQAQKAEDSILNSTKIKKGDIFLQTYNPKK